MRVEKKATETISGNLVFDGVEWRIRNRDCLYFEKKGGGGVLEKMFSSSFLRFYFVRRGMRFFQSILRGILKKKLLSQEMELV